MRFSMDLKIIAEKLDWKLLTNISTEGITIQTGYSGDLLSDVLANAEPGALWITIQKHKNILGVAAAKDIAAVVITGGILPDEELVKTAEQRELPVFSAPESAFNTSGRLFELLKNGV